MPRVDVEKEVASIRDPFSREQARVMWEFHNAVWHDMTLAGDLRSIWDRWRRWRSKPS